MKWVGKRILQNYKKWTQSPLKYNNLVFFTLFYFSVTINGVPEI